MRRKDDHARSRNVRASGAWRADPVHSPVAFQVAHLGVPVFRAAVIDPARGAPWSQILTLGAVFILLGLVVDLADALAAGSIGDWLRQRPKALRWQRYTSGGVYLALGAAAVLVGSGPRHS